MPQTEEKLETVDEACTEASRLIAWLGHVSESEYTPDERRTLISKLQAFIEAAQPIASKYCD